MQVSGMNLCAIIRLLHCGIESLLSYRHYGEKERKQKMRNFDNARIEAARAELVRCGGYIVNMPLGVADDGCFYSIGGGYGAGLWIDRETCHGEFRYLFSGGFDQVISDLYKAIEGGEFDD